MLPHTLTLNLTIQSTDSQTLTTINGIANSIMVVSSINLISPTGTGKTITVAQLTENILNTNQMVAALIPLGEWSVFPDTFFETLIKRNAYRKFKPEHFMQLAYYGRLVLILDGWNELDFDARIRAIHHIGTLSRDFPQIGIIISNRSQEPSLKGITIKIEPLSEDQQMELARKLRGDHGVKLIDQAWRIPSLRELITIPLYFNTLLCSTSDELPKTKEEILCAFTTQHLLAPEKIEILRKSLLGFHNNILIDLAVEANHTATTAILDSEVRKTISLTLKKLQDNGQITTLPQPEAVINTLVNSHLLIRFSAGQNTISFQHQQFQEWYASFHVEDMMLKSSQGDTDAQKILRTEILNWIAWEESILFACERLSRKDDIGERAIAEAIIDTIGIDPMLAAEMIYRSTLKVWALISDKVIAFIKRWHTENTIDRSIRFMIISGRLEFSEYIWPLLSNPDSQIYLEVLRITQPFRPSVLGPDAKKRLAEMPENTRCHVIAEIGQRSGFEGMELATELAKIDQSPQVVAEILEALQFRRADRHVKDILQNASDKLWELIINKGYPDNLIDQAQNTRLAELREKLIMNETDPIKIINYLTEAGKVHVGAEERIKQLIQSPEFPVTNDRIHFALEKAFKLYPQAVANGLFDRIATGLQIPHRTEEYFDNLPPVEDGPIVTIALNSTTPKTIARAAYTIIGPLTLGRIMDELFTLHEKYRASNNRLDSTETEEYHRLSQAILVSRQLSFLTALLDRSGTDQVQRIEIMTDLLARHGKDHEPTPLVVSEDIKEQLIEALKKWIKISLASYSLAQQLLSNIARAIERIPDARFVGDLHLMLKRELDEQEKSRSGSAANRQVTYGYSLQYRKAFAAIGNDNVIALMKDYLSNVKFGHTAACVLLDIWNKNHQPDKTVSFTPWNNFSKVKQQAKSQHISTSCEFADAIFDVVIQLGKPNSDLESQEHALRLARVALNMPYGDKETVLEELYSLPTQYATKQELLTTAAMAGKIIPSNIINAGLQELLDEAKSQTWRLDKNRGELMGWIELFAFSDEPMAVIAAIDSIPLTYRQPWELDRLLSALGNSPNEQALDVLKTLAERDAQIAQQYGWLNALLTLDTAASAYALLNLICDGSLFKRKNSHDAWKVSKKIAVLAKKFPTLYDELLTRYEKMTDTKIINFLEDALIEISDAKIILTLISHHSKNNQAYDYRLSEAIRNIASAQKEVNDWPGVFEQFSIPLTELRKQLFSMIAANDAQSTLAEKCLIKIDELRDEYGRINDEPRHPDITSGLPWPIEAI